MWMMGGSAVYGVNRFWMCAGLGVVAASLIALGPMAAAQPPESTIIQGQLLDDLGEPIVGLRQYRVRFFDAETEGAQLGGDVTDFTQVNAQGLFAIALIPPAAVLNAPAAWYELALDSATPAVGVGPDDVFPQRVRVHSVPFARVAGEALSVEVDAIGGGALSIEEFESLAGITGSVQSQLDAKAGAVAVDDALALKADQAAVDDALDDKADLAEVLPRAGAAFVVVETTEDPVQNAANLQAAYAQAAALTPHGQPLSADNRAVVIVPPGSYDMGDGQLVMNANFVDLVGMSTARDNQYIFGTSNGPGTGVLGQTADDVRIENLTVHCTRDSGGGAGATTPAAYFPDSDLPNTVVRNCRFLADDANALSMRIHITYSGTYEDSTAGNFAFGGYGVASGMFTNCTGGDVAFGGDGEASGTFTNCTGDDNAFGGGFNGKASGTFTNCTGDIAAFGGYGEASGTFTNCTGDIAAFGGGGLGSVASGTFTNCTGGSMAFGGGGDAPGGEFFFCVGGSNAFTTDGSPAPVHRFCVQAGAEFSP